MKKWTKEEIEFLYTNYPYGSKENIIKILNRDWKYICNKSFKLKIKRYVFNPTKSNCDNLMNNSNEAFYWLGFIMADGHFTKSNQLQINIGEKDIEHLQLLSNFLGNEKQLLKPNLCVNYKSIRLWLENEFKITNNKTYEPCVLTSLKDDKLFSFIIGFIDGDGSIDKKGYLHIKCHSSWLDNLNLMVSFLTDDKFNKGIINSEGLAFISITKIEIMNNIKNKIEKLKLPKLTRKWVRIKQSREDKYTKLKAQLDYYFNNGEQPKEIITKYELGRDFVYREFKKWNKERNSLKEKDLKREIERNL